MQTAFFPQYTPQQNVPSGSSFQSKRKRQSWTQEDFAYESSKQARVRSPGFERRTTFPLASVPAAGDMDMDSGDTSMDSTGADAECNMGMGMSNANGGGGMAEFAPVQRDPAHTHSHTFGQEPMNQFGQNHFQPQQYQQQFQNQQLPQVVVPEPQYQRDAQAHSYNYSSFDACGSGGFGFGPGADEDDGSDEEMMVPTPMYPSFTPHPNPHHFSNLPTTVRPKSPLSAQPFSTSLRAPGFGDPMGTYGGGADLANYAGQAQAAMQTGQLASSHVGILQPSASEALQFGASEVEKARAQHGPQCKSIPKLVLSPYPDPVTGSQSMWAMCRDCGAVERSS